MDTFIGISFGGSSTEALNHLKYYLKENDNLDLHILIQ